MMKKRRFNKRPKEYILRTSYLLREDNLYIPRFKLKDVKMIADVPINEPIKPTEEIIKKAIQYGMIFLISYKGQKDKNFAGHERVIYPMVFGKSSKGNLLIRGYHLNGWSVSNNRHIEKIWRMFRFDRVLSITFTGSFYRLPPEGYNMEDRGMLGGIIAKANFNEIEKEQLKLVKLKEIQDKEEVTIGGEKEEKKPKIKVKNTSTKLEFKTVGGGIQVDNPIILNLKSTQTRISFLKGVIGGKYIAVLGAIGETGNNVEIIDERNVTLGLYTVIDSTTVDMLFKIRSIKGNTIFDLYQFESKM
jgi:hypothetical protein